MDGIEYACARLGARYGQRPGAGEWRRIEHARTLAALLDAARGTPFERFTAGLAADADPHAVEALLRLRWRAQVAEVARWMPEPWTAAVRWCAVLPDLPVFAHVARGGARRRWMSEDPHFRELADGPPPATSIFGPLAPAWGAAQAPGDAWHREFRARVPPGDAGPLQEIERAIRSHLAAFRGTDLADGTALRRRFEAALAALFRRAALSPAAAFAYLGLVLLDLERLRGELLRRAVFPRRALAA
jgi:hypothetical protein